jgi:hypothetical protein
MLPASVQSGFQEPSWEKFPEINGEGQPVAELLIKPFTQGDLAGMEERFGICRRCDGTTEVPEVRPMTVLEIAEINADADVTDKAAEIAAGVVVRKPCPVCKGKASTGTGKTLLDLDMRLALGEEIIKGGRTLLGVTDAGEVVGLEYGPKLRDGLCHALDVFFLVLGRARERGLSKDAAKKGSSPPPFVGSSSAPNQDGAQN